MMMTSNKPYLIRALYEWLVDNDATPYILVDTTVDGVMIPPGIDNNGQVVLNIAMRAVQGLDMANTHIAFSARFGGVSQNLYIPIRAVMAIYGKEDGEGMMFAGEPADRLQYEQSPTQAVADDDTPAKDQSTDAKKAKKPGLKIVK